jgi:hypothetical protein
MGVAPHVMDDQDLVLKPMVTWGSLILRQPPFPVNTDIIDIMYNYKTIWATWMKNFSGMQRKVERNDYGQVCGSISHA